MCDKRNEVADTAEDPRVHQEVLRGATRGVYGQGAVGELGRMRPKSELRYLLERKAQALAAAQAQIAHAQALLDTSPNFEQQYQVIQDALNSFPY